MFREVVSCCVFLVHEAPYYVLFSSSSLVPAPTPQPCCVMLKYPRLTRSHTRVDTRGNNAALWTRHLLGEPVLSVLSSHPSSEASLRMGVRGQVDWWHCGDHGPMCVHTKPPRVTLSLCRAFICLNYFSYMINTKDASFQNPPLEYWRSERTSQQMHTCTRRKTATAALRHSD